MEIEIEEGGKEVGRREAESKLKMLLASPTWEVYSNLARSTVAPTATTGRTAYQGVLESTAQN